jgi:hypothetical protein
MNVKITNKGFTALCERMSNLESDMKWVKKIMFYIAGVISVGLGKSLFFS